MEIAIYLEGGGNDSAEAKASLRQGMSEFLKPEQARQRRTRWRVVPCGGRKEAFDAFMNAMQEEPDVFNVLLVDSETAVAAQPRAHLKNRDGWDLNAVSEDSVHLMAQCMETWLVSDPEALSGYYRKDFNANALPKRMNLEEEPKTSIYSALEAATKDTQKGSYGKIAHGSALLKLIDAKKVKTRCPHCQRLFETITRKVSE